MERFFEEAVSELSAGLDVALGGGVSDGDLYYIRVKGANTVWGPYNTMAKVNEQIERLKLLRKNNYEVVTVKPGESVG